MGDQTENTRPRCHFISNTHWDREWRYSMQRTRHMLVHMMDMLLDILEKEVEFKSFHLDSQTIPLQDYLEIRPEREDQIRKFIGERRLLVGPWFVLPDEFCVGGESLVRNLLLGHRIARRFGGVSKTGYSPFGWGQVSQMPQIYQGFGIPFAAFYRGVNTLVAPNSEFIWEGPDGSRIVGSRLAQRPRYNVWYILQRPVYWNVEDENARLVSWKDGHGPFRFTDPESGGLDMQYVHPKFEYHKEHVKERAEQTLEEQDDEWTTRHRFWSAGHDSSCPDIREVAMIADSDEALGDKARVFHSTFEDFQKAVCESVTDDLPVIKGEMRHYYTEGSSSVLFGWITSARTDIKQLNYDAERTLGVYAEPLAVGASLLGAPYPGSFVDHAWNLLLQNHGHDSIGACSRDVVPDDMIFRYRQVREICSCVTERAFMDVAGAIDLSDRSPDEAALVAWNPMASLRTEVAKLSVDVPAEMKAEDIEIANERGEAVAIQRIDERPLNYTIVQSPNDCANMMLGTRFSLYAELSDVPGLGYRTFFVKPLERKLRARPTGLVTGPRSMENEHLAVSVQSNGALTVVDKATGREWNDLGYFRDSSEIGNPWERVRVTHDEALTTLNESARVALSVSGDLVAAFRIEIPWQLPKSRSADESHRSDERKPYTIVNTVTLRKGQPWVEIATELDNTAEDHYLQVSFPTGVKAKTVSAQIPFDVAERPIALPDPDLFDEDIQTEHPMDRFVDITDGESGVALLNEGLKAYEPHGDAAGTLSLTLLRCFPLRICVTNLEMTDYSRTDKGAQCLGPQKFRYAFMPHGGDWREGKVWPAAERFCLNFRTAQIGPTPHGSQPLAKSFLEIEPEELHLSALKQSEDGEGWVVRLFNPTDETLAGRVRLNGGHAAPGGESSPVERIQSSYALPREKGEAWARVRTVTLEEKPEADLEMDADGWATVEITPKKILSVLFTSQ